MIISRRKLIAGIGLTFAAPAIVRASSLMKVKAVAWSYQKHPFTLVADPSVLHWWAQQAREANVGATMMDAYPSDIYGMMRSVYGLNLTAARTA